MGRFWGVCCVGLVGLGEIERAALAASVWGLSSRVGAGFGAALGGWQAAKGGWPAFGFG